MLTTKSLSVVIATVAALSANVFAASRQDNPVHPAYYAERAIVAFEYLPTQPYGNAGNPLHPNFSKTTFDTDWIGSGAGIGRVYVDARNPLHPSFNRF